MKKLIIALILIMLPVSTMATETIDYSRLTQDYSKFDSIIRNDFICVYNPSTTYKLDKYQLSNGDEITNEDKKSPLINNLSSIQFYVGGQDNKKMNITFEEKGSGNISGNDYFEFTKENDMYKSIKSISPLSYTILANSKIRIYIGNNDNKKYFDVYGFLQNIDDSLGACPPVVFLERKNDKEYNLYATKEEADGHRNDVTYELVRSEFGKPGTTDETIAHDLPNNNDVCQFKNPFVTSCQALTYTSNNWGHLSLNDTKIEFGTIKNNGESSKYLYIKDNNFGSAYSIVSNNKKLTVKLHDISFNISETDYDKLFNSGDVTAGDIKIVATGYTSKLKETRDNGIIVYITHKDNNTIINTYDNEESILNYIEATIGGDVNSPIMGGNFTGVLTCDGLFGGPNSEVRKIISNILKFIRYGGPILMLLLTIVDLVSTVTSGEDKDFKKVFNNFIKRFIAAALLFFINDIIKLLFLIVGLEYNCIIE